MNQQENSPQPPQIRVTEFVRQSHPVVFEHTQAKPKKPASRRWAWLLVFILLLILIAVAATTLFFYSQQQLKKVQTDLEQQQSNITAQPKEEAKQLTEKVGQLVILPTGEEPTIATVSDLEKLKGQPFFAQAEVGDKVLIYTVAKNAILYRPSTNKIIAIAPLINNEPAPTQTTPTSSPAPTP